jgi:hypothetical protein
VIGNAVHVMRIATEEIEDNPSKAPKRAKGGSSKNCSYSSQRTLGKNPLGGLAVETLGNLHFLNIFLEIEDQL